MPQQINLLDARFVPRALPWSARQAVLGVGAGLALCAVGSVALDGLGRGSIRDAEMMELAMTPLRQQLLRASRPGASPQEELQRLRTAEAAQRRIRQALETGVAGNREGHAEYLMALARQAPGTVWITGFTVSEDGQAIELAGRMSDTQVFADYLRRLNAEPRFKGRPFAQLQLDAVPMAAGGPPSGITAFALRSQVGPPLPAPVAPPPGPGAPAAGTLTAGATP